MLRQRILLTVFIWAAVIGGPVMVASSQEPVNPDLIPAGRAVLEYLQGRDGQGIITGQNIYPRAPNTYQSVGRRPAIWMDNMEWMTVEKAQTLIRDYRRYRPILCFGWHWALGRKWNAWGGPQDREDPDPYPRERPDVGRVITPGTPEHELMLQDLRRVTEVFLVFQKAGIPILWRGMHEHGGGWFWYDDKKTPENSAELWRITFNYFKEAGVNNLIWQYNSAHGLAADDDYRKRFYPGNDYVDIVDVNMYDSNHKMDAKGQWRYWDRMHYISDGKKLIGGGDQPQPHNPDYIAEGIFPPWLFGTAWEGAPFPRDYTISWARYYYGASNVVTLADLPLFDNAGANPETYGDLHPEVGVVNPAPQTWVYDSDPVIEVYAKDRDGRVTRVEIFAQDVLTGQKRRIASLAGEAADESRIYRFTWTDMPDGTFMVSAAATDDKGNTSDSMNMGETWNRMWSNWVWITKGCQNIAKGKPAVASSHFLDRTADRVTDGNYELGWESDFKGTPDPHDAWVYVDLEGVYSISQVNLRWSWQAYARDFDIQVSHDAVSWKTVYEERGFAGSIPADWAEVNFCVFPAVEARYVRFLGRRIRLRHERYYGYKLAQIEVPIPLAAVPSGTPVYLDLHNDNHRWERSFTRTALGTPGSVVHTPSNCSYRRKYFDRVGEQLCGRVRFEAGAGRFALRLYDDAPRDLSMFAGESGHLHFWARSEPQRSYSLGVRDAAGLREIRSLELTPEWRRIRIPVSDIARAVSLASVKEPFVVTHEGAAATLYFRDLYWSSVPPSAPPANIVRDPSFDADDKPFQRAPQWTGNGFGVGAGEKDRGWHVAVHEAYPPRWERDAAAGRARVVGGRGQGMAQVIGDERASTGLWEFSFRVGSGADAGKGPRLSAEVFGLNLGFVAGLLAVKDPERVGPVHGAAWPAGVSLGRIEVGADKAPVEGARVSVPVDFGSGFDNILILFWTDGIPDGERAVFWIDDVAISPAARQGP